MPIKVSDVPGLMKKCSLRCTRYNQQEDLGRILQKALTHFKHSVCDNFKDRRNLVADC